MKRPRQDTLSKRVPSVTIFKIVIVNYVEKLVKGLILFLNVRMLLYFFMYYRTL